HVSWGKLGAVEIGRRVIAELMEAFQFVVHDPPLAIALVQIALAPTLLLVLAEVGPNFLASLHLGNTGTALFFLLAPAGLGLGIGLFVLGHFGTRLRQERLVLIALIALGISVIGLASVPTLALFWQAIQNLGIDVPQGVRITLTIVPITALMGLEVAFINAPVQTIVQERATGEFRGRVLGFQQTVTAGMAIPPLIVVGGIAAVFGTPATLALMGVVLVLVGLGGVYYS
ncbi:MAG: hypothetical protein ACRDFS_09920, partial [Chloroflexota bacterium]